MNLRFRAPRSRLAATLAFVALATASRADAPPRLVPPPTDSTSILSAPAPLLVPGRANPADTLHRSREQQARQQYLMARALERQASPASAIVAYRNAVQLDPKLRDAHYRMGKLFSAVRQHHAAALEYAAEILVDPSNRDAARAMGLELAQSGDTTRAIRQLELLTRRDPQDEPSWRALGFAYGAAGHMAPAERALRRALALDPKDADAWRDLGLVLAASNRETAAREAYRRAARLDPHDASSLVDLGNLEYRAKRAVAALAAYRAAVTLDSSLTPAYRGQIAVLRGQGRLADAGAVYRRWLAVDPHDSATRMEAMRLFDQLGRGDIALEVARDGVRADPRSGEAHLALGMAHHAGGQLRASLVELRAAEALLRLPEQRARVGALIRALRASAPDSLRALFAADSAAHELPARPDTSRTPPGR